MKRRVGDAAKLLALPEGRRGERQRPTQPVPTAGNGTQDDKGEYGAQHEGRGRWQGTRLELPLPLWWCDKDAAYRTCTLPMHTPLEK